MFPQKWVWDIIQIALLDNSIETQFSECQSSEYVLLNVAVKCTQEHNLSFVNPAV